MKFLKNALIFLGGCAVGAVATTLVTKKVVVVDCVTEPVEISTKGANTESTEKTEKDNKEDTE